jgi:hypothetical protein
LFLTGFAAMRPARRVPAPGAAVAASALRILRSSFFHSPEDT